jgi:CRP-like cAMP-binding protein
MPIQISLDRPISLDRMVERLDSRRPLGAGARAALRALPATVRTLDPGAYMVREGDRPVYCCAIVSGFAFRQRITGDGARLILSIHMAGEFIDLQNVYHDVSDHSVQALTRTEAAFIPREAVRAVADVFPDAGIAMWRETLIDSSIAREWAVNVGRRGALARIAHLLCEFALRLETAGLGEECDYRLPMTQEQIADSCGLTAIHVNRVLRELGRRGLIARDKRAVHIVDWRRLVEVGDFTARYLHLGSDDAKLI